MIFHFELRDMNTHMDTLKLKIFFRHVSILPSLYFEFMLEASPFYPLTMSLKKSHQRLKWDISQENSISRPANLCTLYIQLKQKCKNTNLFFLSFTSTLSLHSLNALNYFDVSTYFNSDLKTQCHFS